MVVNGVDPKTHPGFTMEGLDNDVALLRLSPPINKSANIDFVKMPQKNSDPQEGTKTVAGWYVAVGLSFPSSISGKRILTFFGSGDTYGSNSL